MSPPVLVWFRTDLRLADNPALDAVAGRQVLPVFLLDEASPGRWGAGGASRWWLHHSLAALQKALSARGAKLLLARGQAELTIPALAAAIGASEVLAGRRQEPWAREADRRVHEALAADGRKLHLFTSTLLHEPYKIATAAGKPFMIFTPFSKAVLEQVEVAEPLPAPDRLIPVPHPPASDTLAEWLLPPCPPAPNWAAEFPAFWQPGEAAAAVRVAGFTAGAMNAYAKDRDIPGEDTTSRLSPRLAFGEISPRQLWHAAAGKTGDAFRRQVLWREFSHHLLWHRPQMPDTPLRPAYAEFPFEPNAEALAAWQHGRTGYPLVDAGMRQLWRHGWMHNRVRLVVASFLVKHLLQPWQDGASWFWDTLVDADLGNNSASWQWVAGCGSDAAPYFRVFNPIIQGEKFDPEGHYIRRYLPELARLPNALIHRPWEAPDDVLKQAGVHLGKTYPRPIVDHATARNRALDAFAALPKSASGALEDSPA